MMTFAQIKEMTRAILDGANLQGVAIHPGPGLPDNPDESVVWTPYGGPGLEVDGALDARSWQFRAIGRQGDYESAETIANVLDIAFISHFSSKIGELWVSSIVRVGGAPNPLTRDNGNRTHFVCSYVFSVESALSN
jgi:hypothetical protein